MTAEPGKPSPRQARLVLVTPDGRSAGTIGPFPVATPWWQDAESVVRAARERHGLDVVVLRLLEVESGARAGGSVTYLAQVAAGADPLPGTLDALDGHPLRMPWARPGGPDADLAWATAVLESRGMRMTRPPEQVRTWNLSSLWRLPVVGETCWLKVVPPFFAHEGRLLERLRGAAVPGLLATDPPRVLMPEIPGEDLYDAEPPLLLSMVSLLVGLQQEWASRSEELLELGLPDWRGPSLTRDIASVVERTASELRDADRRALDRFVERLPERFADLEATGLPDGLVHGDFHPGNTRGDGADLVLLDWGDSGVGHPLLDQPAFLDRIPPSAVELVREHWDAEWRRAVPGADPTRAAALLAPVAAARQALIYRGFLDRIEPSEHPYHAADPADWLGRTAALLR